jgi:chromate transporter
VGWTLHGLRGGLAAGLLFILPGALVMLGLSFVYVLGRGVPLIDGALYGIKAAVLVIVVEAIIRIGKRGLKTRLLMALAAVAFIAIYLFEVPFPLIVIPAASIGYFVARTAPAQLDLKPVNGADAPPRAGRWREAAISAAAWLAIWWAPVLLAALALGPGHVLVTLGVFFSKLAVVSFGGAYALLAYMAQQAVENYGWLKPGEMVDALGLAETTPGPLILVTQFVSFLAAWRSPAPFDPAVAATLGAAMATWTVFAPSFLWIFAGAPFLEDLRRNQKLAGALAAITAAVVGVILSLAVWFALHVLFRQVTEVSYGPLRWFAVTSGSIDGMAVALAGIAAILVFVRHVGMIATVVIMAALGIAARLAFGG